jgi:hypothetical protein
MMGKKSINGDEGALAHTKSLKCAFNGNLLMTFLCYLHNREKTETNSCVRTFLHRKIYVTPAVINMEPNSDFFFISPEIIYIFC